MDLLAHDLDITVKLVGDSDAIMFPPARFIYRLIYVEPEFAATVVKRLDRRAKHGLVIEALAHFAYDADRLQALQTLPISLKRDGQFLSKLMEDMGGQWLSDRIGQAVGVYRQRAKDEEVPGDFLAAYEKTLKGAVSTLQDGKLRRELREVIDRAFR